MTSKLLKLMSASALFLFSSVSALKAGTELYVFLAGMAVPDGKVSIVLHVEFTYQISTWRTKK